MKQAIFKISTLVISMGTFITSYANTGMFPVSVGSVEGLFQQANTHDFDSNKTPGLPPVIIVNASAAAPQAEQNLAKQSTTPTNAQAPATPTQTSVNYASNSLIPAPRSGFAVSAALLSLQPSANNMTYAVYTQPVPLTTPNWSQENVEPGYTQAFDLGLQYTLQDGVNQVSVDWLHFDTDDSAYTTASGSNSVAPPYYFGPGAQQLRGTFASGSATFHVDNVNVSLGRLINFGKHIQLQPFAGIDTAYLKQDLTDQYSGTTNGLSPDGPYSITSNNTSRFTGVGPRLGVNATYYVTKHIGLDAEMAAALLAGSMQTTTNFSSFGPGNTTTVNTSLANESQTELVPVIDSKLGLSYYLPFNSGANLTFRVGYLFAAYINGINQVFPTSLVPEAFNNGVIAIQTSSQQTSDLDLNGPYASVTWKF